MKRNLEDILLSTGEMGHMEKLLLFRSSAMKDASADKILNEVIHPTLEDLEFFLRYYVVRDYSEKRLKEIISEWIDAQIKKG
ncbi:hypothetical protein [Methanoplanus limicola]|jgi:hypothetical protein|uniref:Uncharacterized protein n=1 Tax=Methanoplanus limicola DSM 2279 TaxID=937775 RepID=H1YYX9_9EURY|nr:hypothetical protein [Methanoplanus limicola]EHQ37051.1 hypothetical protein Metlim_3019 [Methanoplanus limicola DSM 2279]